MNGDDVIIGIVNYGCGNIASLLNSFEKIDVKAILLHSSDEFSKVSHLVLPGVGSFKYCMERLHSSGMYSDVVSWIDLGYPILGICVGMQMLALSSEEGGAEGLKIVHARVSKLPALGANTKVPHVGWNEVIFDKTSNMGKAVGNGDFYFDHSFGYLNIPPRYIGGMSHHGIEFCSFIEHQNIIGCQFHPEKSQSLGLKFLKYFTRIK